MRGINWIQDDKDYYISTPYGKAIITEVRQEIDENSVIGAPFVYLARFEHANGQTSLAEYAFEIFNHAEGWLLFGIVMDIDQPSDGRNLDSLLDTLDHCKQQLPDDIHPSNHLRIEMIKKILSGVRVDISVTTEFPGAAEPPHWEFQDAEYFANTQHGRAIIKEKRNRPKWTYGRVFSYLPRIENPYGLVVEGEEVYDFDTAERWVVEKLFTLNHPTGDESDLENLEGTLDLCIEILSDVDDLMHILRLEWIKGRIANLLL